MEQIGSRELGKLYKAGEIIFRQGDHSDRFFVIQKGMVLTRRESSAGNIMQVEIGPG
ncbi:MAG: cyclic nucleotide-binding domain-containing protein [Magnetococcus sp. YQC-3]